MTYIGHVLTCTVVCGDLWVVTGKRGGVELGTCLVRYHA